MTRRWLPEFARAASTFDWPALAALSEEYVEQLYSEPAPLGTVPAVLQILRDNLRYEEVEAVADAALAHDLDVPAVRRQYAQALVDGGNPAVALTVYAAVVDDPAAPASDRTDARGGVGRCWKELFLACTHPDRRREYLQRAFAAYHDAYREDPTRTFHGINAVALLARAGREGIAAPAGTPSVPELARAVLEVLDAVALPDVWTDVTAAEACIALGRHDEAIERTEAFLQDRPNAFTVAAFHRQLREVWQLETTTRPGDELLPQLRSALLHHRGGQVTVESTDVRAARLRRVDDGRLERVLGHDRYLNLQWYRTGLVRCRAVARIQTEHADGIGTGFLARGPDLHPDLPPLVLVTNAHVVPEELDARDAVVAFHGLDADPDTRRTFRVDRVCWSDPSAGDGLDTTILDLDGYPTAVEPTPLATRLPAVTGERTPRAYVIGHPRGLSQPQFSLQDNVLLDHDDRLLHYRSPTESGSSGSPVFDQRWDLIAVHHAGGSGLPRLNGHGGTHAANEGIALPAIRTGLAARPPI